MSEDESRGPLATRLAQFDGSAFVRLALWSLAAGVAVTAAVFIGSSDVGLRRIGQSFASIQGVPPPQVREDTARANLELERVTESLQQISSDRNRMIERLEAIERHLDGLTGSINRSAAAVPTGETENIQPPSVSVVASVPSVVPSSAPSNAAASSLVAPAQKPPPAVSTQESAVSDLPATGKVEFGIDLGSAQSVDGLRVLWTTARGRHAKLLEGLRPIITVRENSKPGVVELRLVAGPVPTASLAARLCAVITTAGAVCQPAVFDGQRLALR